MTGAELEKEKKEILNYYRSLLRVARLSKSKEENDKELNTVKNL